jgi:BNR/Asp-box repeat
LGDHEVTALANDHEALWALTRGGRLWRSASDGPWDPVAKVSGRQATCLCPSPSGILVGTSEAHLLRLVDDELRPVEPLEKAEGRDDWYTPWGGPPDVRSISRGDDGAIYVNVHVGGIVRSTDEGESWQPTIEIHSDVHQVLAPPGHPGMVLGACAEGLAKSTDGGGTWDFETDGLHAVYCRAVAVAEGTIYLSASLSHRGQRAALYRRSVDGGSFEKCSEGLPEWFEDNIDTGCVAATGSNVAFGTTDGSVFVSTDAGQTWELWAKDLPAVRCLAFG